MLQSMRDGAQSKVIKMFFFALLIMAGLGLVMSDIGGFFRNSASPTVAFEVDGDAYSTMELDKRVSQILQMQGLSLDQGIKTGIIDQIIDAEIDSSVLRKEGFDLGIRVSDSVVAEDTRTLINGVLGAYGQGVTKENIFSNFLRNLGMSEQQYIIAKKSEITANLVTDALTKTNSTPNVIGKFLNAYENEKRVASTYLVKAVEPKAPTAEQLEEFYENTKESYRKPEYRSFSVASIKYDDIRDRVEISNDDLKAEYEANINTYTTPEVRTISQALLDNEETAKKVYDAAKKDGDIKKAVTTVTGKTDAFLPSADFTKAQLPADFGDASFKAKVGEVSAPFKTDLGWFVLKVEKTKPAQAKPFNDVSAELKKEMQNTKANDDIYKVANQFEDAVSAGTSFNEIAKELNVPVRQQSAITAIGKAKDGKPFVGTIDNLKAAFEGYEGEIGHMIEDSKGDISFVFVDKIEESYIPALADIKAQVEKDWAKDQKLSSSREKAESLIAELKEGKKPVDLKSHTAVSRTDTTEGLDAIAVAALFQIENKGDYITIPQANSDHLIIGLKDIKMELKDGTNDLKTATDNEFRMDLISQYFTNLRKEFSVKKDKDIVETIYRSRIDTQQQ